MTVDTEKVCALEAGSGNGNFVPFPPSEDPTIALNDQAQKEAELKQGTGIEPNPTTATHPSLRVLFDYWRAKRKGRLMPARVDLVANEIKPHLGWVSLIEVLSGREDFRYRLIGTRVTA